MRFFAQGKGELASLLGRASLLHESLPDAHICVHYSVNANYCGGPEAGFAALTAFCRQLSELPRCSLLLVSGGGARKRLDSLRALQLAASSPEWRSLRLPLAVAFNPYFPDEERRAQERQRLRGKLLAGQGRVHALYLQAGSDVQRLREGLVFLRRLLDEVQAAALVGGCQTAAEQQQQQQEGSAAGPSASPPPKRQRRQEGAEVEPQQGGVRVFGSVFVPSRKLLAAMRFRPWGGVFLRQAHLRAALITTLHVPADARGSLLPPHPHPPPHACASATAARSI